MIRLTSGTGPVQIAGNDETAVVISHDLIQLFCVHCGGLKNGFPLYIPGTQMEEYLIKQKLVKEQTRCLCPKREACK